MSIAFVLACVLALISAGALVWYVLKREQDLNLAERAGLLALAASIILSLFEGFAPSHYAYVPVDDIHRAIWEADLGRAGVLVWIIGVYARHKATKKAAADDPAAAPSFVA